MTTPFLGTGGARRNRMATAVPSGCTVEIAAECATHGRYTFTAIALKGEAIYPPGKDRCPKCAQEERDRYYEEHREEIEARQARLEAEERAREERVAAERRQAMLDKALHDAAIPLEYQGKGFDDFEVTTARNGDNVRQALLYVRNFAKLRETGNGLFLYGPSGTGKSHIACAILQALMPEVDCAYALLWQVIAAVKAAPFGEEPLRPFMEASLLVLDEVGVQTGSKYEESILYPLIDTRITNHLPTIFITNVQPDVRGGSDEPTVRQMLGERLWDRVQHRSIFLRFDGQSHRKRFASVDALLEEVQ
ncbi:ATP-binding protein [Sutterella sp.]|uniref:ATP-binding protein n=1 Tax=Sutterella sp. TaxID=1981025 RepID=UPI0026DEDA01|nr:ATP-binding protein [Sutterella sp.]MDO5531042.1 ATP-binding protein [Sutterella sp.]